MRQSRALGTICTFVEQKRIAAIAQVLGEGAIFRCTVRSCEEIFSSEISTAAKSWLEIPGEVGRGGLEGANAADRR
jgi:hypothetical protein